MRQPTKPRLIRGRLFNKALRASTDRPSANSPIGLIGKEPCRSFDRVVSPFPPRRASGRPPAAPRAVLRYKIILPFIALLLFIGLFGTTVVTRQVSDTAVAGFASSLLRPPPLANAQLPGL